MFISPSHHRNLIELTEEEGSLLKLVCSLPLQAPIAVATYKNLMIEDHHTGRIIKYTCRSKRLSISSSAFVSFTLTEGKVKFGFIQSLIEFSSEQFAIIAKFECDLQNVHGLVHIVDASSTAKIILSIEKLSRPHPVCFDNGF